MTYAIFFRRLYPYLKPHLSKIVLTIIAVIVASLLTSALPEVTGRIVDELFNENRYPQTALFYASLLLAISLLGAIFALLHTASNAWVANQVIFDIRQQMFAKILSLPKAYFDRHTTGNTLSKITFDVEQIAHASSTIWVDFARSAVMSLTLVSYLIYKSWQLSLLLIILIPIIIWSIHIASTRMRHSSHIVQQSIGELTHQLNENITGHTLIKLYHAQKNEKRRFFALGKKIRQQRFKVDMVSGLNTTIASAGIGLALSFVVYLSSLYLKMTAGEFLAFFTAMTILIKPIKQLINMNKPLQSALAGGESVFRLIDLAPEKNEGKKILPQIKGEVEFKNVYFSYDKNKTTLNNINFQIKAGQTIALVGKTGSGKSTIVQLLCRFYEPNRGMITVDGVDIAQLELEQFRKHISFVDQLVQLFDGSIAENIALGEKNMSLKIIENAAKLAYASEFIEALADGFDTQIGENGIQLSGGQRQRLAIARAIAKNAPILIFDEATSALDTKTEKEVQLAIDNVRGQKTLIIIAHRLSTIEHADNIIVLDKGRIIEQGNHQTLLANQKKYAKLYQQKSDDKAKKLKVKE